MALRDDLLSPIAGPNPGGIELRYDPIFDKIKEARREDLDAPQGEWATTLKTADWALVIKLAKDAIATKSKDLQIAAWLTEALARREGFPGLRSGIEVLTKLVEEHWEHLYPEIDDGDAEMRAAPLEWVGTKLDVSVRRIAIDKPGHDFLQFKESRTVPTEEAANESDERRTARENAIANGRITPEELDVGFNATPKAWFKALVGDIEATIDAVKALDSVSQEKFADVAPSFGRLIETLEDCLRSATTLYKRKLEIEPDPVAEVAIESKESGPPGVSAAASGGSTPSAAAGPLSPEPTSREDATGRIVGAARYLRQNDPYNPASYLMLRGFRWGELRAKGGAVDPKLLEAPATHVRTNLKGLLLDSKWPELLAASENVMGTPQGRGWIDLQRYAITACDELGSDYFPVAAAIRAAVRALLTDLPTLLDMTLMDDTPTANVETRGWLRTSVLQDGNGSETPDRVADSDDGDARGRDPISLATAEVRGGRADRAIALLMREAGRAKTSRSRFLIQAELARIMVDAGHEAVAMPILDQLIADVEAHKLEEWEEGVVVAAPMALLYRVLEKTDGDADQRQGLYLRICRLDPIQAISFAQP